MAVIVYKWDDVNAQDFATGADGTACYFNVLRHFLVGLFGWTSVHDSTTSGATPGALGRLILRRPSGGFVYVWTEAGDDVKSALGGEGYPDGSVTNYQCGLESQLGDPQWQDTQNSNDYECWSVVYDEASETFIYQGSTDNEYSTIGYTGAARSNRHTIYLSTVATPSTITETYPVLGAGAIYSSTSSTVNCFYRGASNGWTTLTKLNGAPANGDDALYVDEDNQPNRGAHDADSPDLIIKLQRPTVSLSKNWATYPGSSDYTSQIGQLRGIFICGACDFSYSDHWINVNFPEIDQSATGSAFTQEFTLAGKTYLLISDGSDWFGFLSLDSADYGDMA
jgi:hypothetical protein